MVFPQKICEQHCINNFNNKIRKLMFESRFFLFSLTQEPTCSDCLLLSYVAQTGLTKTALNFWTSSFHHLNSGTAALHSHPSGFPQCWGWNPGLCACLASTLPPPLQLHLRNSFIITIKPSWCHALPWLKASSGLFLPFSSVPVTLQSLWEKLSVPDQSLHTQIALLLVVAGWLGPAVYPCPGP